MKITKEQYEAFDESLKAEFELHGEFYVSVDSLKVASLKASLDNLDAKSKAEKAEREAETQRLIDEAREQALEDAKKKNNVDEILKIEREKLEDENKRIAAQRDELTSVKKSLADDKINNVIESLTGGVLNEYKAAFKSLIKPFIDVNIDTRQVTFLNVDGSASSLNQAEFLKDLAEREMFAPLMKASPTSTGGGLAGGSGLGGAETKAPKDMTTAERIAFKKRDPAGFKKAFNL